MGDGGARSVRDERGQVLALTSLILLIFLVLAAFAVDVGNAYFTQRELQRSADAAALAAAQELPDAAAATSVANAYGPADGSRNPTTSVDNATLEVSTSCLSSAPGCQPVNSVLVKATASVDTIFAKVIGIDSITVKASARACSPCAAKPLDIMLVLDRTGSMCQRSDGSSDAPACTDIANARNGMKTFLGFMDTDLVHVGFSVFPPARTVSERCLTPTSSPNSWNYNLVSAAYVVVPLSNDYLNADGSLNSASDLVNTIDCVRAAGRTAYANAIDAAQAELAASGRPGVQDIIVFLSDGAANYGPSYYPNSSPYRATPCHQGVDSAAAATASGTIVYAIGYDLNGSGTDYEQCHPAWWSGGQNQQLEQPPITSYDAIRAVASDPSNFYNKPDPGQLNTIFTRIASDIGRPAARLIDENLI